MPSRAPKYAGTLIVLPLVPFDSGDSPVNQRANVDSSIMSIQNCKGNVVMTYTSSGSVFRRFSAKSSAHKSARICIEGLRGLENLPKRSCNALLSWAHAYQRNPAGYP